jgi:endonuclease-8/formamidopyrimidine-DNA glycosylase
MLYPSCFQLTPSPAFTQVSKLGPDPLRPDDDAERFWRRVQSSKKPIGLLLMDQTAIAGERPPQSMPSLTRQVIKRT